MSSYGRMKTDFSASLQLDEAINEALAPHQYKPITHDVMSDAQEAVSQVEARMRSGAFGGYFIDHDLHVGKNAFGTLVCTLTVKF